MLGFFGGVGFDDFDVAEEERNSEPNTDDNEPKHVVVGAEAPDNAVDEGQDAAQENTTGDEYDVF